MYVYVCICTYLRICKHTYIRTYIYLYTSSNGFSLIAGWSKVLALTKFTTWAETQIVTLDEILKIYVCRYNHSSS